MSKIGIRFKLILFSSLLITSIGAASSWYFFTQTKKYLEAELKKRGYSLISLLVQDGEVKDSMNVAQKAFFEEPIKRLRALDRESELAYWRVLLVPDVLLLEEKEVWIEEELDKIPMSYNIGDVTEPVFDVLTTDNGEQFYNLVAPVYEKSTIVEEEFAAQIFGQDEGYVDEEETLLGVVQIGLSPKRINRKMQTILWTSSIPLGFIIVFVGIGVSYFIARGVVRPIENLVKITDRVASGELDHTVEVKAGGEIGMLASRFNKMTKSLKQTMSEKEGVMTELRDLNKKLSSVNEELVNKNEELVETQERLVRTEKLASIGQLASGVSHELRNPLGAIKNAVFFLNRKMSKIESPVIDEKIIKFLGIMDKEIDKCNKIINNLLGFSRVSKPTKILSDIIKVVNDAITSVNVPENIKLTRDLQSDLPMIKIDETQIGQVFTNLIENACQEMKDGGELRISARKSNNFLEVEFADSGGGIPEKELKKIFDPLFTTKPKGVGMGLAVCHGIIEKHEGTIDVRSREGKGSTMFIKLPLVG